MNKNRKFSGLQELIPTNINKVEVHSRTVNSYFTVLGEEGIGGPEDHYEQLETLKHANDGELFVTTFSSNPGGSYSGILAWKNALEGTMAHTVAILEGDLASASTIVPLYFDEIYVTPHTTFMIHSANLGIGRGTASNVERNAAFQAKQMERFLRDAYRFFLTEEEIQKVLDGVELYLDDKDIQKRLEIRKELLAEECDCEECVPCDDTGSSIENPCKECYELPKIGLPVDEELPEEGVEETTEEPPAPKRAVKRKK